MSIVSYQYCSKEIPMLHSKLDDMSQNEAIIRYLQIACNLPDYGIHFFEVTIHFVVLLSEMCVSLKVMYNLVM